MCVVSIPRLLIDGLIQNLKEVFDPTTLGVDSGGGARGQSYLAYSPVEITMIYTTASILPGTIKSPQSVLLTLMTNI